MAQEVVDICSGEEDLSRRPTKTTDFNDEVQILQETVIYNDLGRTSVFTNPRRKSLSSRHLRYKSKRHLGTPRYNSRKKDHRRPRKSIKSSLKKRSKSVNNPRLTDTVLAKCTAPGSLGEMLMKKCKEGLINIRPESEEATEKSEKPPEKGKESSCVSKDSTNAGEDHKLSYTSTPNSGSRSPLELNMDTEDELTLRYIALKSAMKVLNENCQNDITKLEEMQSEMDETFQTKSQFENDLHKALQISFPSDDEDVLSQPDNASPINMEICDSSDDANNKEMLVMPIDMSNTSNVPLENAFEASNYDKDRFEIPVKWAYMIPPPPPPDQPANDLSSLTNWCYDQNMYIQAMQDGNIEDTAVEKDQDKGDSFPDLEQKCYSENYIPIQSELGEINANATYLNLKDEHAKHYSDFMCSIFKQSSNTQSAQCKSNLINIKLQPNLPKPLIKKKKLTRRQRTQRKRKLSKIEGENSEATIHEEVQEDLPLELEKENLPQPESKRSLDSLEKKLIKDVDCEKKSTSQVDDEDLDVLRARLLIDMSQRKRKLGSNHAQNSSSKKIVFDDKIVRDNEDQEFPAIQDSANVFPKLLNLKEPLKERLDSSIDSQEIIPTVTKIIDTQSSSGYWLNGKYEVPTLSLTDKREPRPQTKLATISKSSKFTRNEYYNKNRYAFDLANFKFPIHPPVIINLNSSDSSSDEDSPPIPNKIDSFLKTIRSNLSPGNIDNFLSLYRRGVPEKEPEESSSQEESQNEASQDDDSQESGIGRAEPSNNTGPVASTSRSQHQEKLRLIMETAKEHFNELEEKMKLLQKRKMEIKKKKLEKMAMQKSEKNMSNAIQKLSKNVPVKNESNRDFSKVSPKEFSGKISQSSGFTKLGEDLLNKKSIPEPSLESINESLNLFEQKCTEANLLFHQTAYNSPEKINPDLIYGTAFDEETPQPVQNRDSELGLEYRQILNDLDHSPVNVLNHIKTETQYGSQYKIVPKALDFSESSSKNNFLSIISSPDSMSSSLNQQVHADKKLFAKVSPFRHQSDQSKETRPSGQLPRLITRCVLNDIPETEDDEKALRQKLIMDMRRKKVKKLLDKSPVNNIKISEKESNIKSETIEIKQMNESSSIKLNKMLDTRQSGESDGSINYGNISITINNTNLPSPNVADKKVLITNSISASTSNSSFDTPDTAQQNPIKTLFTSESELSRDYNSLPEERDDIPSKNSSIELSDPLLGTTLATDIKAATDEVIMNKRKLMHAKLKEEYINKRKKIKKQTNKLKDLAQVTKRKGEEINSIQATIKSLTNLVTLHKIELKKKSITFRQNVTKVKNMNASLVESYDTLKQLQVKGNTLGKMVYDEDFCKFNDYSIKDEHCNKALDKSITELNNFLLEQNTEEDTKQDLSLLRQSSESIGNHTMDPSSSDSESNTSSSDESSDDSDEEIFLPKPSRDLDSDDNHKTNILNWKQVGQVSPTVDGISTTSAIFSNKKVDGDPEEISNPLFCSPIKMEREAMMNVHYTSKNNPSIKNENSDKLIKNKLNSLKRKVLISDEDENPKKIKYIKGMNKCTDTDIKNQLIPLDSDLQNTLDNKSSSLLLEGQSFDNESLTGKPICHTKSDNINPQAESIEEKPASKCSPPTITNISSSMLNDIDTDNKENQNFKIQSPSNEKPIVNDSLLNKKSQDNSRCKDKEDNIESNSSDGFNQELINNKYLLLKNKLSLLKEKEKLVQINMLKNVPSSDLVLSKNIDKILEMDLSNIDETDSRTVEIGDLSDKSNSVKESDKIDDSEESSSDSDSESSDSDSDDTSDESSSEDETDQVEENIDNIIKPNETNNSEKESDGTINKQDTISALNEMLKQRLTDLKEKSIKDSEENLVEKAVNSGEMKMNFEGKPEEESLLANCMSPKDTNDTEISKKEETSESAQPIPEDSNFYCKKPISMLTNILSEDSSHSSSYLSASDSDFELGYINVNNSPTIQKQQSVDDGATSSENISYEEIQPSTESEVKDDAQIAESKQIESVDGATLSENACNEEMQPSTESEVKDDAEMTISKQNESVDDGASLAPLKDTCDTELSNSSLKSSSSCAIETSLPQSKQKRQRKKSSFDFGIVLCPFDLTGRCNDDSCADHHFNR